MTYLIALIIAIALGAVIALLSFVNIGSGFSGQSAAAKAQQFSQIGTQLEIAMASHRASNAASAFTTGSTFATVSTALVANGWLKETPTAPTGTGALALTEHNNRVYLSLDGLSADICKQVIKVATGAADPTPVATVPADGAAIATALDNSRLSCFGSGTAHTAFFRVE